MLSIIDRLESLVAQGKRVPLSSRTLVDEQEFLDIIDQLRVSLPEELRQARRVTQERERLVAEARAESEKITKAAQEHATLMMQETEVGKAAERRAALIIQEAQERANAMLQEARQQAEAIQEEAERNAADVREGANSYARDVLTRLDQELAKHTVMVHRGLDMLAGSLTDAGVR
ncbi:MAG: hypothetical protein M0Z94_15400 [Dehalococcoidales bacterium]|nr:hypothetical protein [Dehalococcoidales bacterium]